MLADVDADVAFVELLSMVVRMAAETEPSAPTGEWSLAIRLASDETITALHAEYFGDATPTDVISFPSGDALDAVTGYLGDIVISVETAALNAAELGHSVEREIAFLALHGLLHLCGHVDSSATERAAMLQRQAELLRDVETALDVSL